MVKVIVTGNTKAVKSILRVLKYKWDGEKETWSKNYKHEADVEVDVIQFENYVGEVKIIRG